MALQSLDLHRLTLGKEAGVTFTVLVVIWLSSRGDLDPLSLLFIYFITGVLTSVYFGVQSLTRS